MRKAPIRHAVIQIDGGRTTRRLSGDVERLTLMHTAGGVRVAPHEQLLGSTSDSQCDVGGSQESVNPRPEVTKSGQSFQYPNQGSITPTSTKVSTVTWKRLRIEPRKAVTTGQARPRALRVVSRLTAKPSAQSITPRGSSGWSPLSSRASASPWPRPGADQQTTHPTKAIRRTNAKVAVHGLGRA